MYSEQLKKFRIANGLTKSQMARLLRVTRKTYLSWEDGVVPRSSKARRRISEVLELDGPKLQRELKALDFADAVSVSASVSVLTGSPLNALWVAFGKGFAKEIKKEISRARETSQENNDSSMALPSPTASLEDAFEEDRQNLGIISTFLIRAKLDDMGIVHSIKSEPEEDELETTPDSVILMPGNSIENWWLCFWPKQREMGASMGLTTEMQAHLLFARFLECMPDSSRKISIVTDDQELYEAFKSLAGHNSYRGNVSVVLVNPHERRLVSEVYLAAYDDPLAKNVPFQIVEG